VRLSRAVDGDVAVKLTRLYTGEDGRSHFEELELPLAFTGPRRDGEPPAARAVELPVAEVRYLEVPAGDIPRHTAPRRLVLMFLAGRCEIECADGRLEFGPERALLAEDVTGEGHSTSVLEDMRVLELPLRGDWKP
jgi:hypothetical protein